MICKRCNIDKDLNDFHKKKSSKTGYQIYCKFCSKKMVNNHYSLNKEEIIERKREYRDTDEYKINSKIYEKFYKERRKVKRRNNINYRISMSIRDIVRRCLKYKGDNKKLKTFDILGYKTND